jgi:hypothetical protein
MRDIPLEHFVGVLKLAVQGVSAQLISLSYDIPSEQLVKCLPFLSEFDTVAPVSTDLSDDVEVLALRRGLYIGNLRNGVPHGVGFVKYSAGGEDQESDSSSDEYESGFYVGGWVEGKRHGYGISSHNFHGVYEGDWEKGKEHGGGSELVHPGWVRVGDWKEGTEEGYMLATIPSGLRIYEGMRKDCDLNGVGTHRNIPREPHTGMWKNKRKHGFGVTTYPDGSFYAGEWKRNCKHGEGTFVKKGKWTYKGDWEDDMKSGYGEITFTAGDKYHGFWSQDQISFGTYTMTDGLTCESYVKSRSKTPKKGHEQIFAKNFQGYYRLETTGTVKCLTGKDVYTGPLVNFKKEGFGKMIVDYGEVYEGHFVKDKYSGEGTITYPSGLVYKGSFKNGKQHGRGVEIYPNGIRREGRWRNDRRVYEINERLSEDHRLSYQEIELGMALWIRD